MHLATYYSCFGFLKNHRQTETVVAPSADNFFMKTVTVEHLAK